MKTLLTICSLGCLFLSARAQEIPSRAENLENLVTFGKQAPDGWGDDDHVQIFFMLVPKDFNKPMYLSVFDPGVGGKEDMLVGGANTSTRFSIYGGKSCYSEKNARQINPTGNYKSGNLIYSKTYGVDNASDGKWVRMATLNPQEGEFVEQFDGYVFKVICEGLSGDDGNHYRYFMSSSANGRVPVPGGNGFTYEYSFQLKSEANSVAHLYPYVDNTVDYIVQSNFDFDNDGFIKVFSVARHNHIQKVSGDGTWGKSKLIVRERERNKSFDIQIVKTSDAENDMVFYVVNQYNEPIPFFASPLGPHKFIFKIDYHTPFHK